MTQTQITPKRLKERREKLGFNLTDFAKHCRVPHSTYEQWEYGKRRIPATVIAILESLEEKLTDK